MIRANALFRQLLPIDDVLELSTAPIPERLRRLVTAPLVEDGGGLFLQPLLGRAVVSVGALPDRTGREAFVNKFHVGDFVDDVSLNALCTAGTRAALLLSRRLADEGSYRVILSVDGDGLAVTMRFFERRPGETWGPDNPDDLKHEGALYIDT